LLKCFSQTWQALSGGDEHLAGDGHLAEAEADAAAWACSFSRAWKCNKRS